MYFLPNGKECDKLTLKGHMSVGSPISCECLLNIISYVVSGSKLALLILD